MRMTFVWITWPFGLTLGLHRRWVFWHYLNEAGLASIQFGPLIAEVWAGD